MGAASVTILVAHPRRLLVSVRAGKVAFNAAVLHSPHRASPECASDWWKITEGLCGDLLCNDGFPCLYFVDANATLPDWPSDIEVPVCDPVAASHCPDVVCSFIVWGAWLPALHASFRRVGAEQTTFHMRATGRWSLIDYVGLSSDVWAAPGSCHALCSFDMAHDEDDHRPTVVSVKVPVCSGERPCPRRTPQYSRTAVYQAIVSPTPASRCAAEAFRQHLRSMSSVAHPANPTSQAERIQTHVFQGLR